MLISESEMLMIKALGLNLFNLIYLGVRW